MYPSPLYIGCSSPVPRLSVLSVAFLFSACATLSGHNHEPSSPVPEWVSNVLQCNRQQLNYEWNHARYVPTDNDSACVIVGRWGRPASVQLSRYFTTGFTVAGVTWVRTATSPYMAILAGGRELDSSRPMPGYFKIESRSSVTEHLVPDTSHVGVVVGVVFDTLGQPLPRRVSVCATRYIENKQQVLGCTRSSIAGTFRLDSLPLGSVNIRTTCETIRLIGSGTLFQSSSAGAAVTPGTVVILFNTRGCDLRPLRTISGIFRGHWSTGFEENAFSPCPSDSWQLASDTAGVAHALMSTVAWVDSLPKRGTNSFPSRLHGAAPNGSGGYVSYVKWHATITGPSHFGHLGGSSFRMVVDSIIAMRVPSAADCR